MKKSGNSVFTFRTTPEITRQIAALSALWGENKSRAIQRAISVAWQINFPARMPEPKEKK